MRWNGMGRAMDGEIAVPSDEQATVALFLYYHRLYGEPRKTIEFTKWRVFEVPYYYKV